MPTPIHDPDLVTEVLALRKEVELLKRAPRWRGAVLPAVPLQAVRDFGFTSLDTTSYADFFRADVLLTAPILDYDIQTWNFWESSAVTSIEWRITAGAYFDDGSPFSTVTVASGSSSAATWSGGAEQFSAQVDVTSASLLGPAALFRLVRFDFECKRTGGSGDGAALRLVRPPILRIPT